MMLTHSEHSSTQAPSKGKAASCERNSNVGMSMSAYLVFSTSMHSSVDVANKGMMGSHSLAGNEFNGASCSPKAHQQL